MKRRAAYQFERREVVAAVPGLQIVLFDLVPNDAEDELIAVDVVHQGANPTDLAIGLVNPTFQAITIVTSATDAARPVAGVPIVLSRPFTVPPGWQLLGSAATLNAGETMSIRALWRRVPI